MGNQVLFMDPYVVYYPRQGRNLCASPVNGIGAQPDPRWDNFRDNLGYILNYSRRLNLERVHPRGQISTTGFCLAQTPATGAEFLCVSPSGGRLKFDFIALPALEKLALKLFNPRHWFH